MRREDVLDYINEYLVSEFGEEYKDDGERMVGLAYTTFNEFTDGRADEVQVWYDTKELRLITEVNGEEVENVDYPPEWIAWTSFNDLVGEWVTDWEEYDD